MKQYMKNGAVRFLACMMCAGAALAWGFGGANGSSASSSMPKLRPQAIQTMQAGQRVWACDPATGQWSLRRVVRPLEREYEGLLIEVQVGGQKIQCTDEHPFWVVDGKGLAQRAGADALPDAAQGMQSSGRWVSARDLQPGDTLLIRNGEMATVEELASRRVSQKVFNLEVEGLHTYAVGELGVLVHNACGKPAATPAPKGAGPKGLPDHQKKVAELGDRARGELRAGEQVLQERRVQGLPSRRIPDQQIVDPTGKTRKVFEAERYPNRTRHQNRLGEYDGLGIQHETHRLD